MSETRMIVTVESTDNDLIDGVVQFIRNYGGSTSMKPETGKEIAADLGNRPTTGTTLVTGNGETINAGSPERDINGRPWDERIHAGTKGKTQKGTWKYKRGVDDLMKQQVEAELDALSTGKTPEPVVIPDGIAQGSPVALDIEKQTGQRVMETPEVAPVLQAAPAAPIPAAVPEVAPVPQAAPAAPVQQQVRDWPHFISWYAEIVQSASMTADEVKTCLPAGVVDINGCAVYANQPAVLQQVINAMLAISSNR